MKFSDWITEQFELSETSKAKFCEEIDIHTTALYDYMHDKYCLGLATLDRIADNLGYDVVLKSRDTGFEQKIVA